MGMTGDETMFGHKKDHRKRSNNPFFVIFRLLLSLIIFGVLLVGSYSAYRQFSGYDPLKLDPRSVLSNFTSKEAFLDKFLALLSVGTKSDKEPSHEVIPINESNEVESSSPVKFKFALVADSHNDNANLAKALQMAKDQKVEFIIGLGDYTDVGTLEELQIAKAEFDLTGIRYFPTAGDHDLWDSRDKKKDPLQNYLQLFGPPYQAFTSNGVRFIVIDNSDNYTGLGEGQKMWLDQELEKAKADPEIGLLLVFMHEPLYHPSSDHFMGKETPSLQQEAKELAKKLKEAGVKEVVAGDIHYFTRYKDPETGLQMTTLGAITSARNAQTPRFAIVSVREDSTYHIEDVEIK